MCHPFVLFFFVLFRRCCFVVHMLCCVSLFLRMPFKPECFFGTERCSCPERNGSERRGFKWGWNGTEGGVGRVILAGIWCKRWSCRLPLCSGMATCEICSHTTGRQAGLIDWLVDWLVDWLIGWLIVWLIDWLVDWLIDWLFDWLVDWLVDWLKGLGRGS